MKKLFFLCLLLIPSLSFGTITRVQSKTATTGGSTASSLAIVLDAAPTNGNIVIVSCAANPNNVDLASTADITWFGQSHLGNSSLYITTFIGWVRTGSASATITLTVNAASSIAAVAAEYSGFTYARIDQNKFATGLGTSAATGATNTTRTAAELEVATIGSRGTNGVTFSAPTNSFAIVGQTTTTLNTAADRSVALLEKIVSSTGTANAGATVSASNVWYADVVTLDESPSSAAVQTAKIYGQ